MTWDVLHIKSMIPAAVLRIDYRKSKTEAGDYNSNPSKKLEAVTVVVVRSTQMMDIFWR